MDNYGDNDAVFTTWLFPTKTDVLPGSRFRELDDVFAASKCCKALSFHKSVECLQI